VAKNKLIQRGSEIVLIDTGSDKLLVGQTLAVQKFEDYSQRDYGRPERNMKQGMLPPKLAKMLVNLAQATTNSLIIDPFCGSGTVLQEARLLGYKNIFGSDNNPRAIEDSKNNLTWLEQKYNLVDSSLVLKCLDVRNLTKYIPESSPKVIITEPYLGPIRLPNNKSALERVYQEIASLFLDSFRVFSQILKTDERVVMVFPLWKFDQNVYRLSILPQIKKMGFSLAPYPDWVGSPPFLYHRPDQIVQREIFIFIKNRKK